MIEYNVRKKQASFIESYFKYKYYYFFNHRHIKKVIYNETIPFSEYELKIKSFYDAYCYLNQNSMAKTTTNVLKKFFYLCYLEELDDNLCLQIQTIHSLSETSSLIENSIETAIYIYEIFKNSKYKEDIFLLFSIFLNYCFIHNKINPIRPYVNYERLNYENYILEYSKGNKIKLIEYVLNAIKNESTQPKKYYKNLMPIKLSDIIAKVKEIEEIIRDICFVKKMIIYGSFADGDSRFDSDIDLLVSFNNDLSFNEKQEKKNILEKILFSKFKRFVDVHELSQFLLDEMVLSIGRVKIIF